VSPSVVRGAGKFGVGRVGFRKAGGDRPTPQAIVSAGRALGPSQALDVRVDLVGAEALHFGGWGFGDVGLPRIWTVMTGWRSPVFRALGGCRTPATCVPFDLILSGFPPSPRPASRRSGKPGRGGWLAPQGRLLDECASQSSGLRGVARLAGSMTFPRPLRKHSAPLECCSSPEPTCHRGGIDSRRPPGPLEPPQSGA